MSKQASSNDRRNHFLINPQVQMYMIVHAVLFGACFLIAYGVSEYFFFEKFRQTVEGASSKDTADMLYYLQEYQWVKVVFVLVSAVLLLTLAVLQMLYVSHRICGPIHKINTFVEGQLKGEAAGEVKLRDDDFFTGLANSLNQLLAKKK